jgi:hypothetical protein
MAGIAAGAWAVSSDRGYTQAAADPNAAPNPYKMQDSCCSFHRAASSAGPSRSKSTIAMARLGPEHGIISTLVAEYLLATALLFVPTLLLARRSEVASLADVLSGR